MARVRSCFRSATILDQYEMLRSFRARTSISKREVTQSLRDAEHVFGLAHSLARNLDIPVSLRTITGEPADAARKTRALLGLPASEPVRGLIRALEGAGVWVLAIPALGV